MFKAVYFHKTVRAGEVMLLESMELAEEELGLTSMSLDDYLKLSDEVLLSKLLNLPEHNSKLKTAKKIAADYQNRNLLIYRSLSRRGYYGHADYIDIFEQGDKSI